MNKRPKEALVRKKIASMEDILIKKHRARTKKTLDETVNKGLL